MNGYVDLPRMANDLFYIAYGPIAQDQDNIMHGAILAWLATADLEHKDIFTLALEWKRMEKEAVK